jgi:flagellar basal-body rod protein FlgC
MSTLSAAIKASGSALNAERTRIEVAVSNLANATSTRSANGQPYRRRDVVLTPDSTGAGSFDAALGSASATGVKVAAIVEDTQPFQEVYDPSHPDADPKTGKVLLPNVNPEEEMVDMLQAARAYQANLAAVNVIRDMVAKALELGK